MQLPQFDTENIRQLEAPQTPGSRLYYRSNIFAFNVHGGQAFTPLHPFAIVDDLTGVAILLIVCEASGEEKQTYVLGNRSDGTGAQGWLLRSDSGDRMEAGEVRRCLTGESRGIDAFALSGRARMTLREGRCWRVSLEGVSTMEMVPANVSRLRTRVEFWEHQAATLAERRRAEPDNELFSFGAKQAEESLHHLRRLMEADPRFPAGFTDGDISAEWIADPIFEIDLP